MPRPTFTAWWVPACPGGSPRVPAPRAPAGVPRTPLPCCSPRGRARSESPISSRGLLTLPSPSRRITATRCHGHARGDRRALPSRPHSPARRPPPAEPRAAAGSGLRFACAPRTRAALPQLPRVQESRVESYVHTPATAAPRPGVRSPPHSVTRKAGSGDVTMSAPRERLTEAPRLPGGSPGGLRWWPRRRR